MYCYYNEVLLFLSSLFSYFINGVMYRQSSIIYVTGIFSIYFFILFFVQNVLFDSFRFCTDVAKELYVLMLESFAKTKEANYYYLCGGMDFLVMDVRHSDKLSDILRFLKQTIKL